MRKVEPLPTRDCEADYGPAQCPTRGLPLGPTGALMKRFLINGAPSHPLSTGTLKQSYATDRNPFLMIMMM